MTSYINRSEKSITSNNRNKPTFFRQQNILFDTKYLFFTFTTAEFSAPPICLLALAHSATTILTLAATLYKFTASLGSNR
jgi:hypothetical protein